MKKIYLTLLMLVAATATMAAQDPLEQTDIPTFEYFNNVETGTQVIISHNDPEAVIYFRFSRGDSYGEFDEWTDWIIYDGSPMFFTEDGYYCMEAIACVPGKTWSEKSGIEFYVHYEPAVITRVYSFIVDGIYYSKHSDNEVWVTTEALEEHPGSTDPQWMLPHAAYQCYSGEVVIPSSVEYEGKTYTVTGIALSAFENCDITKVILPNTITEIYHQAFWCSGLREITIPSSVTSIGDLVFAACNDLTKIVCMGTVPPDLSSGYMAFYPAHGTLFVPLESLDAYKNHEAWSLYYIVPFIGVGPGDIDGSGTLDVDDVVDIIGMILEGSAPEYADVNGDGSIDIDDITVLINMLLNGH